MSSPKSHGVPIAANDVVEAVTGLEADGITVWVDGGWGIDALLGEVTRDHSDLDLAIAHNDLAGAKECLGRSGFRVDEAASLSASLQLRFRLGYEWDANDEHDVRLIAGRFGLPLPPYLVGLGFSPVDTS